MIGLVFFMLYDVCFIVLWLCLALLCCTSRGVVHYILSVITKADLMDWLFSRVDLIHLIVYTCYLLLIRRGGLPRALLRHLSAGRACHGYWRAAASVCRQHDGERECGETLQPGAHGHL